MALFKLKPIAPIDFKTFARPSSPNIYFVCPAGFSAAEADLKAPIFNKPLAVLIDTLVNIIQSMPRVTEITANSGNTAQLSYVQRTALMGYPDIITIEFIGLDENRSTLAMYSRSQYGYYDIGTNKRRITAWLSLLKSTLADPN